MDKKTKTQLGITGILAVILLFIIMNASNSLMRSKEQKDTTLQTSQAVALPATVKNAQVNMLYNKSSAVNKDLSSLRDPFAYPAVQAEYNTSIPVLKIKLNAILWDKDQSLAVINHKVVKRGDKAGRYTVVEIKADRIILNDGIKDFELKT
jgi:hypothetical protein